MNNDVQNLIDFSRAIAVPLYNTDAIKWPIRSGHIISQVGDLYAREYIDQLYILYEEYDPSLWRTAISNSLSIWRMAHHIINGLEKEKTDKNSIAQACLLMINIIENVTNKEKIFSEDHIILNDSVVNALCHHSDAIADNDKIQKLLSLSTLLWAYAESIYFQGREICCEYHGPYLVNERIKVMVRDYKNFDPKDLWLGQEFESDIRNIRIVTFHNEKLNLTIDAYNNVNIPQGNFLQSCFGGAFFINGYIANEDMISMMLDKFGKSLVQQLKLVNSLDEKELYRQYLKIFWYRKKSLAEFLSVDWRPPEIAFERMEHAEIKVSNINKFKTSKGIEFVAEQYNYAKYL